MADDQIVNDVSVAEMEALIKRLPTVLRCVVSVNDWGAVEEIHVLTTVERAPKQIVRDVESALYAQWNLRVDHKRISVAQIVDDGEDPGRRPDTLSSRLVIAEYRVDSDAMNHSARADVSLTWSDDRATVFRGEWQGRYVPSQHFLTMAWASVDAVNKIPHLAHPFVLTELKEITLASRPVIVVAVCQVDDRRRESLLVGASEIRGDGHGASVRAVLDAINRRAAVPRQHTTLEEGI